MVDYRNIQGQNGQSPSDPIRVSRFTIAKSLKVPLAAVVVGVPGRVISGDGSEGYIIHTDYEGKAMPDRDGFQRMRIGDSHSTPPRHLRSGPSSGDIQRDNSQPGRQG